MDKTDLDFSFDRKTAGLPDLDLDTSKLSVWSPPKPTRTVHVLGAVQGTSTPHNGVKAEATSVPKGGVSDYHPVHRSGQEMLDGYAIPQIAIPGDTKASVIADGTECRQERLEDVLINQAIDNMRSLPQVIHEVALKQKDQSSELSRQEDLLKKNQELLHKVRRDADSIKKELKQLQRHIFLAQQHQQDLNDDCDKLQSAIQAAVTKCGKLEGDLFDNREETAALQQLIQLTTAKMEKYKLQVAEVEADCEYQSQLRLEREKLAQLVKEEEEMEGNVEGTEEILSGRRAEFLESTILGLRGALEAVKAEKDATKQQIGNAKKKQTSLKQSIEVLHKRNNAQMLRMKKQLKELQAGNRHWNEQAEQLKAKIAELKALDV